MKTDSPGGARVKPRVLLVEFINADQFPGSIRPKFPAIKGYLAAQGVPVAWMRFAIAADNQFRHGRDEVTLEAAELALLERRIRRLRANTVLSSHPLFLRQRRRLERLFKVRIAVLSAHSQSLGGLLRFAGHPTGLILDPLGEYHADYRWEPGNAAAERPDRNNVYLDTLSGCGYFKPASSNPCYAGVKFPRESKTFGCSFCGYDERPRPVKPAIVRSYVSRQLQEIRRTLGPDRLPGAVMVENVAQPGLLEFILRELRRLGMSKTVLLAAARIDHLVGLRTTLKRTLDSLRKRSESLHIYTTGIENFSDPELLRFNKGFDSLTAVRAVNLLKEFEVRYARNFHYSGYMPLGFILFSPWTRLEDLRRNLRLIQHQELEYETGNLFMSRLRLHPTQALTALADKDGLLTDTVDDSLRLNRRKLFGYERPWRFADPRLEPVNRVAMRIERNDSFADDTLYSFIREGLKDADRRELIAVMLCLVEAAHRHSKIRPPKMLFEEALALWKGGFGARVDRGSEGGRRLGLELLSAADLVERLLPVIIRGGKPALSISGLSAAGVSEIDLPALAARGVFAVATGSGEDRTLYMGRRRATVERLARVDSEARRGSRRAAAQAGRMLGYPDCCVRAWVRRQPAGVLDGWDMTAWRQRAGAAPVGAEPLLSPDLRFLPCKPGCRRAQESYSRWLSMAGVAKAFPGRTFLFGLEDDRELASISVLDGDPRELRYDPARIEGVPGRLSKALEQGDRVLLLPGQVEVRRGERLVACWVAEVAVWDARRGLDAEMWSELAKAADRRKDPEWRRRSVEAARAGRELALDRATSLGRTSLLKSLEQASSRTRRTPAAAGALAAAGAELRFLLESSVRSSPEHFGDVRVVGAGAAEDGSSIDLKLSIASGEYHLRLVDRDASSFWLLKTEDFAVICDPQTPIPLDVAEGRLARLLRLYATALRRCAPQLMPRAKAPVP